ncbi:MAG: Hsp20/alpha crystallin family protein [Spirochaetes bacterium]|nr:Hsp20/alpha crystallin family protein [Spirochaetota bacterium]MBU0956314.1 Hsp20/alpha crystallin family protein [Spirochaetota bacterium]
MNLIRRNSDVWSPAAELQELQNQINQLFDFDYGDSSGLFDRYMNPAVDIIEEDNGFLVHVDVPGIDRKELSLSMTRNVITIKGEKKEEARHKGRKSYRNESWSGSFQRTLSLPDSVDPDKVDAELKNGVLSIRIAKREELKPKQIAVNVH